MSFLIHSGRRSGEFYMNVFFFCSSLLLQWFLFFFYFCLIYFMESLLFCGAGIFIKKNHAGLFPILPIQYFSMNWSESKTFFKNNFCSPYFPILFYSFRNVIKEVCDNMIHHFSFYFYIMVSKFKGMHLR